MLLEAVSFSHDKASAYTPVVDLLSRYFQRLKLERIEAAKRFSPFAMMHDLSSYDELPLGHPVKPGRSFLLEDGCAYLVEPTSKARKLRRP